MRARNALLIGSRTSMPPVIAALSVLPLSGCLTPAPRPDVNPPLPQTSVTYDQRMQSYASALNALFGANGDRRTVVIPVSAADPPGTILIPGGQEFDQCKIPDNAFIAPDPAVGWQPPIGASSQFAFSFDLPAAILSGLSSANAKVAVGRTTTLSVDEMTRHVALLAPFEQVLNGADCKPKIDAALAQGKTVTVIRGEISGKQSFTFDQDNSFSAGASVQKVGDFNITIAPNKVAVAMQQTTPSVHFLVTYNIAPAGTAPVQVATAVSANPASPAVPAAAAPSAAAPTAAGSSAAAGVAMAGAGATSSPQTAPPPPLPPVPTQAKFVPDPAVVAKLNPKPALATPPNP